MVSKDWKMMKKKCIHTQKNPEKSNSPLSNLRDYIKKGWKQSVELKTSKSIPQVKRAIQTLTAHIMHVKISG